MTLQSRGGREPALVADVVEDLLDPQDLEEAEELQELEEAQELEALPRAPVRREEEVDRVDGDARDDVDGEPGPHVVQRDQPRLHDELRPAEEARAEAREQVQREEAVERDGDGAERAGDADAEAQDDGRLEHAVDHEDHDQRLPDLVLEAVGVDGEARGRVLLLGRRAQLEDRERRVALAAAHVRLGRVLPRAPQGPDGRRALRQYRGGFRSAGQG